LQSFIPNCKIWTFKKIC